VSWRVETAPPVIAKVHKPGKLTADPMLGLYDAVVAGKPCVVEYEPDADLRDTEQVPLLEEGGIEAFIRREVLPYTPDAWVNNDATKIGYEISFTRHFYKPQPLRTLAEISADILAIEKAEEAEGRGMKKATVPDGQGLLGAKAAAHQGPVGPRLLCRDVPHRALGRPHPAPEDRRHAVPAHRAVEAAEGRDLG
jgi:hypothetical protein